jgi:hypothetical protein
MNHSESGDPLAHASREEIMSALFANMVVQQTNLAMMMLGRVAHPETGQFIHDVEAARMFIDQLEMIEAKTKGNLTKEEEGLLKQGLTALRMAFVEAIDSSAAGEARASAGGGPAPTPPSAAAESKTQPTPAPSAAEEESRKKFSKKY